MFVRLNLVILERRELRRKLWYALAMNVDDYVVTSTPTKSISVNRNIGLRTSNMWLDIISLLKILRH